MATTIISDNTTGAYTGDYSGTDDGFMNSNAKTTNYGATTTPYWCKYAEAIQDHGLLAFPGLSNITGPVTVSAVTLGIYQESAGDHSPATYDFRRLLRNWVEAQATWNIYSTGNNWGTAGGLNDETDRIAAASAQLVANVTLGWYTITSGLEQDVEDWINGVNSNYGWHVEQNGTWNSNLKQFRASEYADGTRPYLSVTYAASGAGVGRGKLPRGLVCGLTSGLVE